MALFILPPSFKMLFQCLQKQQSIVTYTFKIIFKIVKKDTLLLPSCLGKLSLIIVTGIEVSFSLGPPFFFCFWLQTIKKNLHKMNHQYLMFLQNTLDFGRLKQMSSSQYSRTFWARSPSMEKIIWYPSHFLKSDNQMLKFSLYSHFHVSREAASKSSLKGHSIPTAYLQN